MANQRNLQKLSEAVGRRLEADAESTGRRSNLEKAQAVRGMLAKQQVSRLKSTAEGSLTNRVSQKWRQQDAILSEQVKHAQQEALRRFIGQVIE